MWKIASFPPRNYILLLVVAKWKNIRFIFKLQAFAYFRVVEKQEDLKNYEYDRQGRLDDVDDAVLCHRRIRREQYRLKDDAAGAENCRLIQDIIVE